MRRVNNNRFRRTAVLQVMLLLATLTLSTLSQAQGPTLTTISDTVYRADGTPAEGTVLISWPSFQTAAGDVVAAGNLSVTLGPSGAFTAQLTPNVGASPAGTFYVVVLQLDDGTVRTEYWAVPTTSPTNIAAVLTTPGTGLANLAATQQYVNSAVAGLAVDSTVVHLAGTETITGTKQFTAPPSLPSPVGTSDGATKGYVDAAVANVGSGAYVAIAGGTMTGPLNLPADPTSPSQAADRHYVDNGLAAKANLVNAVVPTNELGAGVASSATCLNGNSAWGSCGSGAPAGITYATTALNWTQTISNSLTGGTPATVTLTPCPVGIDTTSGDGYPVFISGGGNSEAANVISMTGGCTSGAASGTITFTPFFSYPSGYTIGSASSGIQETLNAACGTSATYSSNVQCNVIIPSNGPYTSSQVNYSLNNYNVYGTIFLHSSQSTFHFDGAELHCYTRGPCIQIGVLGQPSTHFTGDKIDNVSFGALNNPSTSSAFAGVNITNTAGNGTYRTVTTATAHNFRPGDVVTILFTDNPGYWGDAIVYDCGNGSAPASCTSSSTTFRYLAGTAITPAATPGIVALAYSAILDNGMSAMLDNISEDLDEGAGQFNNFFDVWDDENLTISHFNNQAISLNHTGTWNGSFVFSGGAANGSGYQLAPVITLRDSTITANFSSGVTVYNSNGLYIDNTVIQSTGLWEIYGANTTGNYQGTNIRNLYNNSSGCCVLNPGPPAAAKTPFPGLGGAGYIAGSGTSAAYNTIKDGGGVTGYFPSGGTGSTYQFSYYIVTNDTTSGKQTSPMQILNWSSTGSDSIPVKWPRVANGADAITYDVIRTGAVGMVGSTYPYTGGCPGGSGTTCGYVAQGLSQAAACSNTLICSYMDSGAAPTLPYSTNPTLHPLVGTYTGTLNFWPGALVVVGAGDSPSVIVDVEQYPVVGVGLHDNPAQVAQKCVQDGQTSSGGYTACSASNTIANNAIRNQTALLLSDGGLSSPAGSDYFPKGRVNFTNVPGLNTFPHHIITLLDSQAGLTQTTIGMRPPASANDVWIGTDANDVGPAFGQLSFGAPVSITNYIAQIGDGVHANWLEKLSATLKEFNVPAKFDQSVTLAGLSNGCLNISSGVITSTGAACGGGGGGGNVNSVFGRTGAVVAATGDYAVSQVTGAAADAAVVHNTGNETIAGAKTFTNTVTMSNNLLLPQGNGYVPAVGGIGFDTAAGLPIVNIGGTTQQVALTSSNISGQAGTALALAGTPTQCSGSFATGIAANGNANCTTASLIQLAETTQPAGIPNWGVFWFDSSTHTPRVIDNNGQVMQLGLTNLFNSDPGGDAADNLEERNGGNSENLRVYSNFVNNTTWQRASLGYDATDNYAVLRSENATSASAPGLGFWIGSGLKWVVDASGNLKPWTDNTFNLGSNTGNAAKSVFAKTSFDSVVYGRNDFEIPNDSSTGTTLNELAMFNSNNPSQAVVVSTSSPNNAIGVVQGGAGKSGDAVITWHGYSYCIFDNATTAGDAVVASTATAGECHDSGSNGQPSAQVIGYVDVTNTASGQTNGMRVSLQPPPGGGGGSVASVFGRTGAVTAASGDYSVAQVTGAAADSAVVHLAGTETITGTKTFSSNVTLNGNLNVTGNINQTGSGPTQWSGQEWTGTTVTVPSGMAFSLGVGSDNTFKCQLTSGASCMPSSMVYPAAGIPNSTGSAWGTSYNTSGTGTTVALTASPVFTGSPTVPGYAATGTLVSGDYAKASGAGSIADAGVVAGPYSIPWAISLYTGGSTTASFNSVSGKAQLWGFSLTFPETTTQFSYYVQTADTAGCTYDTGIVNTSGNIAASGNAHIGNITASAGGFTSTGWHTTALVGSSTLQPGKYYIALTASLTSGCAVLGAASTPTFVSNTAESVTSGGTLNNGITIPADSVAVGSVPSIFLR
jgi:baseplate protein BppL